MSELKDKLTADMKAAMKAKDKARLGTIRLALSEIKQREVDSREELDDTAVLAVIDKMIKQRRDSANQYTEGGRADLAEVELAEVAVLQAYLPAQLSAAEIDALIEEAVAATGATGMQQMGAVMGILKPKAQGRADMGAVSKKVRARLAG